MVKLWLEQNINLGGPEPGQLETHTPHIQLTYQLIELYNQMFLMFQQTHVFGRVGLFSISRNDGWWGYNNLFTSCQTEVAKGYSVDVKLSFNDHQWKISLA